MSIDDQSPEATSEAKSGSVTRWLGDLQHGGDAAVQPLWERYFSRLIGVARSRLAGRPGVVGDEEDAALSAFNCFVEGAKQGKFPRLDDRECLWRLLATLAVRKAAGQQKHITRQKRGGDRVVLGDAALVGVDGEGNGLDLIADPAPTPELAAILVEECRHRLGSLPNEVCRKVALAKMQGYTDDEIAKHLEISRATVARKLSVIRETWRADLASARGDHADAVRWPAAETDP